MEQGVNRWGVKFTQKSGLAGLIILLFILALPLVASARTIYVNVDAAGLNDGTSWADAFTNLQDALVDAGEGDEIWVAKGTYKPTDDPDRTVSFNFPAGTKIYGGFLGDESNVGERDWIANETVLSGFVFRLDETNYVQSYTVVMNSADLVDGFIITGGCVYSEDFVTKMAETAGMTASSSSDIANCKFTANRTGEGGALTGGRNISDCIFEYNRAYGDDVAALSGAATISNCVFQMNFTDSIFEPGYPGNIVKTGCGSRIVNSVFLSNLGAAVHLPESCPDNLSPAVINSSFYDNSASIRIDQPWISELPIVANSIVLGGLEIIDSDWNRLAVPEIVQYSMVSQGYPGEGNIDTFPYFTDDFHLLPGSRGIDEGSNEFVIDIPTDFDGNPRVSNGIVDMGAYEFQCVDEDGDGYTICDDDADDNDPTVHPGHPELCDGKDNNQDGQVDEDNPESGQVCATGLPGICSPGISECTDGVLECLQVIFPEPETCDGIDNDCDAYIDEDFDLDQDGYAICGGDCDDSDPLAYPGSYDLCDGVDNDCNGTVDDGDDDGDGITECLDVCPDENAAGFDADENGCVDSTGGFADMVNALLGEGEIDPEMENSILTLVENAQKSYEKGNICTAVNQLETLKNHIEGQRGNKVSDETADLLLAYLDNIIAQLLSELPAGETCG